MARVALGCRLDVVDVLTCSVDTVVAGRTIATDAAVIKTRHSPRQCVVATVAGRGGLNMPRIFARRSQAVVTLLAATHDLAVLDARKLRPVLRAVAGFAVVRGRHVPWRLAAARDRRRAAVAGTAIHRCALEPAIDMTGLALDKAVETLQRKPRGIVVETGGKCMARIHQENQHDQPTHF